MSTLTCNFKFQECDIPSPTQSHPVVYIPTHPSFKFYFNIIMPFTSLLELRIPIFPKQFLTKYILGLKACYKSPLMFYYWTGLHLAVYVQCMFSLCSVQQE